MGQFSVSGNSYQIHRPQKGRHIDEAVARLEELEGGERTPIGYGRAVKRIRKLAESGNAGAMFHMGKLSVHGIGMPQDMQAAEAWYLKAIAAGEMRACCNLGWIYQYGFGIVAPNKDEAFRLLSLGAESGVGAAKASIGLMLLVATDDQLNRTGGCACLKKLLQGGTTTPPTIWQMLYCRASTSRAMLTRRMNGCRVRLPPVTKEPWPSSDTIWSLEATAKPMWRRDFC